MSARKITLRPGEWVLSVVPERCAGPEWSNAVVWVHIAHSSGTYRTECIQPHERTQELSALFGVCESAHQALMGAVPVSKARGTT